jgi:hypothetical protein
LNLPNPVDAAKQARQSILFFNTIPDKFENNQAVHSNSVSNEINRVITRSSVVGVLGREGQIRTKNKLENTTQSLNSIDEFVQQADKTSADLLSQITAKIATITDPTQSASALLNTNQANLQLQTLKIQNQQSKLMGETLAQNLQTNQFIQYSNLNLANISQQIEESNRARRLDSATEASRLLRTTSQIELFGTKPEN